MKKLLCKDLGGPCDTEIAGNSFEEIGKHSQAHVMEEINKGDEAHMRAAEAWSGQSPEDQQAVVAEFKKKYDEAPEV